MAPQKNVSALCHVLSSLTLAIKVTDHVHLDLYIYIDNIFNLSTARTRQGARDPMLPTQSWDCPRQLTLAEQLALQHFRNHAPRAVAETVEPVDTESRKKGVKLDHIASFSPLPTVLQEEYFLLEASVARARLQRAPRGAKKLQSSFDDLLPDQGTAGTADATTELNSDNTGAHAAQIHTLVVRRLTIQTSEPGENSGASLLCHSVHTAPGGCDVFQRQSCLTMSPDRANTIPDAGVARCSTPTWPVAASGVSPKLLGDAHNITPGMAAIGPGLRSPPLSLDLHNVTVGIVED